MLFRVFLFESSSWSVREDDNLFHSFLCNSTQRQVHPGIWDRIECLAWISALGYDPTLTRIKCQSKCLDVLSMKPYFGRCIMDDSLVFSGDVLDHITHLDIVLQVLGSAEPVIRFPNYYWASKIEAIKNNLFLTCKKFRMFAGMVGWIKAHLSKIMLLMKPIHHSSAVKNKKAFKPGEEDCKNLIKGKGVDLLPSST